MKNLARNLRRKQTEAERLLWVHIRNRRLDGYRFRRQEVIGSFIVDFVCLEKKLIIELDGGQHVDNAVADAVRTQQLEEYGYHVIRFWNDEVLTRTDDVLSSILKELQMKTSD